MRKTYARIKAALPAIAGRCEAKLTAIERHSIVRKTVFFSILAMIGLLMYMLNVHTPLNVDDYDFMYSWATGEFLTGVLDVIRSQSVYYRVWGGRFINHANLQLMMYLGKDVYNVVNTAMYLLLLLEIYYIARSREDRWNWILLVTAHLVLMTMVPFFGMVCLWATGACNYLWGTVLALMPALLLRSVREGGLFSKGRAAAVLCVPIGFIAGWTNENTTCGMIALVFIALTLDAMEGRKVYKRLLAMWLAQCAGAIILLAAPGNGVRAATIGSGSLILEMIRRIAGVTAYGASYLGVLFAVVLLLSTGLRRTNARIGKAFLLLFGALIASYAMIGSPVLSDRTFTSSIALVLAALCMLLADALERMPQSGAAKLAVLPALLMVMAYTGYHAVKDVREYEGEWLAVVDTIETAVAAGEEAVVVPSVRSHSRFTVDTLIMEDPTLWPNSTMEKYYGIRVIGE